MSESKSVEKAKSVKKAKSAKNCIEELGGFYCNICKAVLKTKIKFLHHYRKHNKENVVYTCVSCHEEIESYSSFWAHCYKHTSRSKLVCNICKHTYSKTQALTDHLKNIHGMGQYLCPAPCNQVFNNLTAFKAHIEQHKKTTSPYCQLCKTELATEPSCVDHLDAHLKFIYSCPICNQQFNDKSETPTHLHTHFQDEILNLHELTEYEVAYTPGNPIKISCGICQLPYKTKAAFEAHYTEQHSSQVIYSCAVCWKDFDVYNTFSNHCYNHLVKGKFKCDVCEKSFPRLPYLVLHMETTHISAITNEKPFECIECKQKFQVGKSLKQHLIDHHGVSYQICSFPACGKMFDSPTAFVFHQIEHHRSGPLQRCDSCGLSFKNLLACYKHMDVHRKVKFTCPICERKYSEKYLIIKHLKQHYQRDTHICQECGKMYNIRSRLVEHMKIHKNDVHACSYCGKKYATEQLLNDHINKHTNQQPYRCWVCSKRFTYISSWRKHLKNLHNITSVKKNDMFRMTDQDELTCDDNFNILDGDEQIVDEIEDEEYAEISALAETIGAEVSQSQEEQILDLGKHVDIDAEPTIREPSPPQLREQESASEYLKYNNEVTNEQVFANNNAGEPMDDETVQTVTMPSQIQLCVQENAPLYLEYNNQANMEEQMYTSNKAGEQMNNENDLTLMAPPLLQQENAPEYLKYSDNQENVNEHLIIVPSDIELCAQQYDPAYMNYNNQVIMNDQTYPIMDNDQIIVMQPPPELCTQVIAPDYLKYNNQVCMNERPPNMNHIGTFDVLQNVTFNDVEYPSDYERILPCI